MRLLAIWRSLSKGTHRKTIRDITLTAGLALVIILPLQRWVVKPYIVRQVSMEPTLQQYNYLLVNRIAYHLHSPQRGDIIVFQSTGNVAAVTNTPTEPLIKRIIALPGEHIEIKDKQVFIEGRVLDESEYLPANTETWGDVNMTLGDGQYFVMGDNRNHSQDSRWFGPITSSTIIGPAWCRLLPLSQLGYFQSVHYPL